jgi:hypothetical protein
MQVLNFANRSSAPEPQAAEAFVGTALVVLFAPGEQLERVRREGGGPLALRPPFHVGEDDTYLVLPDDIGEEIVDILRDADADLLHEALREGLLVVGQIGKNPAGRGMALDATVVCGALQLLESKASYAAELELRPGENLLRALNTLPHAQCTTLSALVDDDGLEAMLREPEYIGTSWRAPASVKALQEIEPTHVWTRRRGEGEVGIELALFQEDDELIALVRPARLHF